MGFVDFSEKIKLAMEYSVPKWSVAALAREADIPGSTLNNAVKHGTEIGYRSGVRVAKALRVSADWLLDDEKGPKELNLATGEKPDWFRRYLESQTDSLARKKISGSHGAGPRKTGTTQ